MGKVSRRPAREAAKQALQKKHQYRELRQQQQAAGLIVPAPPSPASRLSPYQSVEEECHARTEAVTEQARVFRAQLPTLLKRLRQIQDTRNPKKLKHALVSLMLYGILVFVLHYSSRREANTDITRPMFEQQPAAAVPRVGQFAPCRYVVSSAEQDRCGPNRARTYRFGRAAHPQEEVCKLPDQ
ncbi:MAG: hypothetical protein IPH26_18475 [Sterolibacteriaceae bacterium]|uniref:Transmembrane protein n=1 Tax=Candidatus Methylophosphatis roskildensis TaxID=2899263 RepID=A0A9D7E6P6_9PROT|nr:hypothetical protein [Candidatus Methylophosphatis roskildensis]